MTGAHTTTRRPTADTSQVTVAAVSRLTMPIVVCLLKKQKTEVDCTHFSIIIRIFAIRKHNML